MARTNRKSDRPEDGWKQVGNQGWGKLGFLSGVEGWRGQAARLTTTQMAWQQDAVQVHLSSFLEVQDPRTAGEVRCFPIPVLTQASPGGVAQVGDCRGLEGSCVSPGPRSPHYRGRRGPAGLSQAVQGSPEPTRGAAAAAAPSRRLGLAGCSQALAPPMHGWVPDETRTNVRPCYLATCNRERRQCSMNTRTTCST